MFEIDSSSSGYSNDFASYDIATGTVEGYLPERIAPVRRQKIDTGPVVPFTSLVIDAIWLPVVTSKTNSGVERNYRRYHGVSDEDAGQLPDVLDYLLDDLYDIFVQEMLWERDGGSFITDEDCSFITIALIHLSKTVSTSGY